MNLRTHLYKSLSKILPHCNTKVIFQSKDQLSNLFKFKDYIHLCLRFHLIYKFQCRHGNCNITYYGETECHFKVRAGEHNMSALTRKGVNNNKKSVVRYHCVPWMILSS